MCGLIAGTGRIDARRLIALGCLSESRGSDSAGVGWVQGEKIHYLKIAKNPLVAFPVTLQSAIRSAVRNHSPLIGHTRQATTGDITSENAHPFIGEGIVFAHNGVILNYEKFGKYEVDSQSLIHGIKKRDFSEYEGPIALVWIENGKLHAMRKGNPLFRGTRKRAVYLASERDFLTGIGCKKIKELGEGRIYCWKEAALESVKAVPVNRIIYSRHEYNHPNTSLASYEKPAYHYEKPSWWERNHKWDHDGEKFVPIQDSEAKEVDTLAEADGEVELSPGEKGCLWDAQWCLECKTRRRLPASEYCRDCIQEHWEKSRGKTC